MVTFPPFRYEPLERIPDAIRLVEVQSELVNGLIQCSIVNASTKRKYTALSYTWGAETDTCVVSLNGEPFAVRRNLWDFLHRVRQQKEIQKRLLWIDAICIDQFDVGERNHQVEMMASIYASAELTIMWLGPFDDASSLSVAHTANATTQIQLSNFDGKLALCFDALQHVRQQILHEYPHTLPAFEVVMPVLSVVESICQHPYWSRIWIIQELMLSPNRLLIFDTIHISWSLFAKFLTIFAGNASLGGAFNQEFWPNERPPGRWKREIAIHFAALNPYKAIVKTVRNQYRRQYGFSVLPSSIWGVFIEHVCKLLVSFMPRLFSTQTELMRMNDLFANSLIVRFTNLITPIQTYRMWMGRVSTSVPEGWDFNSTDSEALLQFANASCQDQRDRLYALRSLLFTMKSLPVDYRLDVHEVYFQACEVLFESSNYSEHQNPAINFMRLLGISPFELVFGANGQIVSSSSSRLVMELEARKTLARKGLREIGENCGFVKEMVGVCPHCQKCFQLTGWYGRWPLNEQQFCSIMLCRQSFMRESYQPPRAAQIDHVAIFPDGSNRTCAQAWQSTERKYENLPADDVVRYSSRHILREIVGLVKLHCSFHDEEFVEERPPSILDVLEHYLIPSTKPVPDIDNHMIDQLNLEEITKGNFISWLEEEGFNITTKSRSKKQRRALPASREVQLNMLEEAASREDKYVHPHHTPTNQQDQDVASRLPSFMVNSAKRWEKIGKEKPFHPFLELWDGGNEIFG